MKVLLFVSVLGIITSLTVLIAVIIKSNNERKKSADENSAKRRG